MRPLHCPFHQPSSIISMLVMMSSGLKEISSSASVERERICLHKWWMMISICHKSEEIKECQTSFVVIKCYCLLATRQVFIIVVFNCKRKLNQWVFSRVCEKVEVQVMADRPGGTRGGGSSSSYSAPSSSSTSVDLCGSGGASGSMKSSERGGNAGGSSYSGSSWKDCRINWNSSANYLPFSRTPQRLISRSGWKYVVDLFIFLTFVLIFFLFS